MLADGHLVLLHRLEQRALHLRRRPIDLVREDQVAEDRTVLGAKFPVLGTVDHGAHDVGGQHVGGELEALEFQRNRARQCLQGERLRETGHALEQHVSIGQKSDQEPVDQVFLSDDHPGYFVP